MTMMVALKTLLPKYDWSTRPDSIANLPVEGLSLDSRTITPGQVFLACIGHASDGRQYIEQAVSRGAIAVICEGLDLTDNEAVLSAQYGIPAIKVIGLSHRLSEIAACFYQHPAKQLTVIGITGTNGKTSCSHFIATALPASAVIGTLGNGPVTQLENTLLTTPDALGVQQLLRAFAAQSIKTVAMEVSSHALVQGRVSAVQFKTAVFTNLTRDHLDYHGDMKAYGQAKRSLFFYPGLQYAVINADDAFGRQLLAELPKTVQGFAYTQNAMTARTLQAQETGPVIYADNIQLQTPGLQAQVITPWGTGLLQSNLMGRFNLSNLLAVLTTLGIEGMPLTEILSHIARFKTVAGRMQTFGGGAQPLVIVDYAHTPDALMQVLVAVREHCTGTLWCVFGCGGNRDRGKRPLMAEVVEQYSDRVMVTDDNPRYEAPADIVHDILQGFQKPQAVQVRHGRALAIQEVLAQARPGDIVVIAGKGHENYQQIDDQRLYYSDAETVKAYFEIL